jgi:hypothetical protein
MLWIWHFSAASSCKLLENSICCSLIILYRNVLFSSHHLYHVFCLLTLCFLLIGIWLEVEKTRAAVGFRDPECLCSTTLNNTNNTLAFVCDLYVQCLCWCFRPATYQAEYPR